mgnify:CR=1 FL=1
MKKLLKAFVFWQKPKVFSPRRLAASGRADLAPLLEKMPKGARAEFNQRLGAFEQKICDHLPWIVQAMHEGLDKVKNTALIEFEAYVNRPSEMPTDFARRADTPRAVADYIAGMTDRFAVREHARLTGQQVLT